ncbi:hypothetical protein SAMN04487977_102260 [Treponema bryantii]|jgi:uncharacterized protein YaaR (DUF327 family)|uniref:Uncharacterized protein n=1 Tax=Treponema bryantii TaxID=163 RepID=A0A1H9CRH1_9SPIR|nr:DUF327 family protein [Treponema bryantii]BDC92344.1 hypothetical protein TRBR_04410 [Treponema bryantii]SEQ03193.1 hypothetical protein SAMN04487977_102260 [Treponema bryantii]
MAEIDSLGSNYYYSGVQNASNEAIKRNTKKEEVRKTGNAKKLDFGKLLKGEEVEEPQFIAEGLPLEVQAMSIDDAAVYLADAVGTAGNDFSDNQTQENLERFKTAVSQFIRFVVVNNFNVNNLNSPKKRRPAQPPRLFVFSDYTLPKGKPRQKVSVEIINQKLDALARETLSNQSDNLKILAQVNEIKGLIVDLMSS